MSGPFCLLPLEIQEEILLSLPATDMAPVESSSSYFRALVLDSDLWRKKAETVGKEALAVMIKEIDKMAEKVEEKRCMWPMHDDIARMYKEQDEEEAQKKVMEDESDSSEEDEESDMEIDVKVKSETERSCQQTKNDAAMNKNKDDAHDMENVMEEEGSSEIEPKVDENEDYEANKEGEKKNEDKIEEKGEQPEKKDVSRYYVHNRVSTRWDPEGRKVDCGLRMCNVCLDFDAMVLQKHVRGFVGEYQCMKCKEKTILDDWDGSIQTEIDKEVVRKEKLEELLAEHVGAGKEKMRAVLEFLRDTPPFPSMYFDMAMNEGMPMKKEEGHERGDCVLM